MKPSHLQGATQALLYCLLVLLAAAAASPEPQAAAAAAEQQDPIDAAQILLQLQQRAANNEFIAGFGGYAEGSDGEPLEETNGESMQQTGGAYQQGYPNSPGFTPPNVVSRAYDMQDQMKADMGFMNVIVASNVNAGALSVQDLAKLNFSAACNLPFQLSGSFFPKPMRCSGCLSALSALLAFMKADLNFQNPQMAQYEFSKSCLYVEADYVQICQYMYNVHGRHIVSMLFQNKIPMHICTCINFCDASDNAMYSGAFTGKS
eukprot:gnl/Hemi2/5927_TR2056_c0_g1_i1.p1 gnl/Hemi2/5927_TR2056_c0_g1~~gnl/Hemi2/5927_TR2056_c0_g1_i1.p1  ORF type:complete len:262 (-),score=69.51 gnl/Hemi2/5927_TR2056_c0_g1_i1:3-788(-)